MTSMQSHGASATASAAYWFQFFLDAGIPAADAGSYAVAFAENRIQQSMMCDLSKEYLNEMGITVMGDAIAIMKHAKVVHAQSVRDKAQSRTSSASSSAKVDRVPSSVPDRVASSVPPARTAPQQTKSAPALAAPVAASQAKQTKHDSRPIAANVAHKTAPVIEASKSSVPGSKSEVGKAHLPQVPSQSSSKPSSSSLVRLAPAPPREEVPVKKIRKVTAEQEGPYKIKLPSGSTEKTRLLLEQAKAKAKASIKSKDVFDRLGKETVSDDGDDSDASSSSSSSREIITDNRIQKVAATLMEKPVQKPLVEKVSCNTSIFSRLGGKVSTSVKRPATVQDSYDYNTKSASNNAKSNSMAAPPEKRSKNSSLTITLPVVTKPSAARSQHSEGIFSSGTGGSQMAVNKSARLRLGTKTGESRHGSATTLRKVTADDNQKPIVSSTTQDQPRRADINERIGRASIIPITFRDPVAHREGSAAVGSVFSRLGKSLTGQQ